MLAFRGIVGQGGETATTMQRIATFAAHFANTASRVAGSCNQNWEMSAGVRLIDSLATPTDY